MISLTVVFPLGPTTSPNNQPLWPFAVPFPLALDWFVLVVRQDRLHWIPRWEPWCWKIDLQNWVILLVNVRYIINILYMEHIWTYGIVWREDLQKKKHLLYRSICRSYRVSGATVQDKSQSQKKRSEFPNTVCLGVQLTHMAGLSWFTDWWF